MELRTTGVVRRMTDERSVVEVGSNGLVVSGLDAQEGSVVIDIKGGWRTRT